MAANSENEPVFFSKLRNAWEATTFVKVTLSAPELSGGSGSEREGLRNIKARPVELREGRRMCLVECFPTRELTRNYEPLEGMRKLAEAFETGFTRGHLFTLSGDFQFRREPSGRVSVRASRPAFTQAPDESHDKRNPVRDSISVAPFLQRLGVTDSEGMPRPGMAGKLRQVQRFVEILGHLLDDVQWDVNRPLRVADMGAGKGYLTFALSHALNGRGLNAEVTGVEMRPELVAQSNGVARELGFHGLHFVSGSIGQWEASGPLDVLVALHACNTATDEALFQGVRTGAELLVTSPCCHQEIRPQMKLPGTILPVAGHGILRERQAEILTDALRAHLLEMQGYDARVFEFVDLEHSGKNLMLAGVRRRKGGRDIKEVRSEFEATWNAFGLRTQRLAALLGEEPR